MAVARTDEAGIPGFSEPDEFHPGAPPLFPAEDWLRKLRGRKILVRWFNLPEVRNYLRITIGTQAEAAVLVNTARAIVASS